MKKVKDKMGCFSEDALPNYRTMRQCLFFQPNVYDKKESFFSFCLRENAHVIAPINRTSGGGPDVPGAGPDNKFCYQAQLF